LARGCVAFSNHMFAWRKAVSRFPMTCYAGARLCRVFQRHVRLARGCVAFSKHMFARR
jgi:hypothetical protein